MSRAAKLKGAEEGNEQLRREIESLKIRAEEAEAAHLHHRYRTVLDSEPEDVLRTQIKDLRATLAAVAEVLVRAAEAIEGLEAELAEVKDYSKRLLEAYETAKVALGWVYPAIKEED